MTLKEFFDSNEKLAIHCDTLTKAKTLLKAFDSMGKKWCTGVSYLVQDSWNLYSELTCYTNNGEYCSIGWYKTHGVKVIEFEDIKVENGVIADGYEDLYDDFVIDEEPIEDFEEDNEDDNYMLSLEEFEDLDEDDKMKYLESLDSRDLDYYGYAKCYECGEIYPIDDMQEVDGDYVCQDCIDDCYSWCERCEEYHRSDDFERVITDNGEEWWCDYCTRNYAQWCDVDESYVADDYVVKVYNSEYNYFSASIEWADNNAFYYDEDEMYVDSDNWDYDREKPNWKCGYIKSYHDNKGNEIFYTREGRTYNPRDFVGLGFELEIDSVTGHYHESDEETARRIMEDIRYAEDRVALEEDGSVTFEIISQPHTIDAFYDKADMWDEIIDTCKEDGWGSHDAGTCGLHVHISRNLFGQGEEMQDNVAKMVAFYEEFKDDIIKISRRKEFGYCEFLNNTEVDEYDKETGEFLGTRLKTSEELGKDFVKGYADRYHVVNNTNSNTVEVRVMRGTLKKSTFWASIDFIWTIANNAVKLAWEDLKDAKKWLSGMKKETLEYIKSRGAFTSALSL